MRTQTLTVAMNGDIVGTLFRDGNGAMSFQYVPEWLAEDDARPISLSLPLRRDRLRGPEIFNFFHNLLPDSADSPVRLIRSEEWNYDFTP